jgi:hypothetical protein
MNKITLFSLAIVCLVFSYCRKDNPVEGEDEYRITIEEARSFFDKELAHAAKLTKRHELITTPDWQHFSVREAGDKKVLIIPLVFKNDLTIKANEDKASLSVQSLTRLFFYKESNDRIVAELVTTVPDDTFLDNRSAGKQFTGMVWIERWNGSPIGGYKYAADGKITGFDLGPEITHDSLLKESDFESQWCYVDFYYCVDAWGYVTCRYNFSQAYSCGGGAVNVGGLGGQFYPVYGSGNPGGTVPPGDVTIGIGLNTTILAPPDRPILDPYQYKRCFSRDSRNTYRIILYVDQPIAGTRTLIADKYGNTDPLSIDLTSKSVGHTWITFEERRPNGAITRRSYGFWPQGFVTPANPRGKAILGNDEEREYDVNLEIGLTSSAFWNLLNDCSTGNTETYDLNTNNCTGWAIDKIFKNTSIILPETLDTWSWGLGKGPTPGNLGEDIRQMDLNVLTENPAVTSVKRNTATGKSLRNYGNCPILPSP